jgi:hypothetical protein
MIRGEAPIDCEYSLSALKGLFSRNYKTKGISLIVKAPSLLSTEITYKEVHYQATACLCRCQTAPCFLSYIAMTKITAELYVTASVLKSSDREIKRIRKNRLRILRLQWHLQML